MGEGVADIKIKMVERVVQAAVVRVVYPPVVRSVAHLQQQLDLEMRVEVLEVHSARRRVRAAEVVPVVWVFIHSTTTLKHLEDQVWRTQFQEVRRRMQREAREAREIQLIMALLPPLIQVRVVRALQALQ